ncbi:hypothetical protein [Streptomyces sp. G45]|uniref:hypothetical protein n=1 Tax=Streptomyces sp. G45 TaxID=3406627 RepID=UPI003C25AC48
MRSGDKETRAASGASRGAGATGDNGQVGAAGRTAGAHRGAGAAGTAERSGATGGARAARVTETAGRTRGTRGTGADGAAWAIGQEDSVYEQQRRPLWVEEPAGRPRLPDPVRTAAVRAVLIVALTLTQAMTAFFCALAESWLAFPMILSSVASTVVATWGVLDVWVTRQVWNQRNGVVSAPSSTARQLRRERRRARRQARAAARTKEGIRGRGGARQLSHS